jgi:hypothetical protein
MIVVATSSVEAHSFAPVCRQLDRRSVEYVLFLTDRLLSGADRFRIEIMPSGGVSAFYGVADVSPSMVTAGWYWKVTSFRVPGGEDNVSRQMTMTNEVTALQNAIWSVYPDEIWLSSPAALWQAERKLTQLATAQSIGFAIPQTIIASKWSDIEDTLLESDEAFIVKMARGVLADQNVVKAMQTTRIDRHIMAGLRQQAVPFPGIYQPFLGKTREWRITVVGDDVFAATIYTTDLAKIDWRQHQVTDSVRFERAEAPSAVASKCIAYLQEMELGYGAFDLVEEPSGNIVFLECNPSGQFSWLEERVGLPISDAIAAELVRRHSYCP